MLDLMSTRPGFTVAHRCEPITWSRVFIDIVIAITGSCPTGVILLQALASLPLGHPAEDAVVAAG
jgi:hypothetical protein